jgi:prevent-host-death family protein
VVVVNIHQAKIRFSKLVKAAVQGEEVIIAKAGVPIVRLVSVVPVVAACLERKPGGMKAKSG